MSGLRHGPPLAMNGYMDKEGRKFRARKTRYFKLKDSALFNHRRKDSLPTWGVSLIDSRVAVGHKGEVIVQLFDGKKILLFPHSRSECDQWVDLLQRASRRKIGNYYGVTGLVGMGSFAEVRIGYDKSTGQQVAIKVMKKNKRDTELMRSVECEMNFISKNIDHMNIVATYDVFDTRDNLFIVMEYMPGGMLYDILANEGYFSEKNAASVMRDLLEAVHCLHENDIVHRDIKPENVLAVHKTWPLDVKLADFGLADFVLENSFGEKSTCGMYGTPFFVAPEVIRAETYTPAVDIWSLGVLAYNMLSGKLPFDGNNIKEVLRRVRAGRYTFPDAEWADISNEAKDFIRGLLELQPRRRFTAQQALQHAWLTSTNISERAITNDRSALGYEQRKLRMSSMAIDDVAGLLSLEEEDEDADDHGLRALSRLFPGKGSKSAKSSRSSGSGRSRTAEASRRGRDIDDSAAVSNAAPLRLAQVTEEEGVGVLNGMSTDSGVGVGVGVGVGGRGGGDLAWGEAMRAGGVGAWSHVAETKRFQGGLEFTEKLNGGSAEEFALPAILSVKDIVRRKREAAAAAAAAGAAAAGGGGGVTRTESKTESFKANGLWHPAQHAVLQHDSDSDGDDFNTAVESAPFV
ncbi:Myosin light chain kinase A [Gracilariopsis chorda]|uniref:Myosin light chain kinase A n=1 Tax=Gracilariopsis chorda TaxID=448386 RepID=A0A2V3ILI2_9FLOR|nr:Myosin light chain kinase A [Gracilariopsis chorda]|eukprot:PXF42907.1 Myosin light chain kinase A [Gracilariopsis chorda]